MILLIKNKRVIMTVQVTIHEKKIKTWAALRTRKINSNAVLEGCEAP